MGKNRVPDEALPILADHAEPVEVALVDGSALPGTSGRTGSSRGGGGNDQQPQYWVVQALVPGEE